MPENENSRLFELSSQALAAGMGVATGLPFGPVGGAFVSAAASAFYIPIAEHILAELGMDARRRCGKTLAAASDSSGLSAEELDTQITADERLRLAAGLALAASTRTTWEEKLRLLGQSLASGMLAKDEALVNTEEIIIAAISDMEAPHLTLLELLVRWMPLPTGGYHLVYPDLSSAPTGESWHNAQRVWRTREIAIARPRLRPILPNLIGVLQRHGLATQNAEAASYGPMGSMQGRPEPVWSPTEFGELLLQRFYDVGASVPDTWLAGSRVPEGESQPTSG